MRKVLVAAALTAAITACGAGGVSTAQPTVAPVDPQLTWAQYHGDPGRTGYSSATPPPGHVRKAWTAELDGAVYGQALVAKGLVFAATEGDSVYALDPRTGAVQWRTSVGTPVPRSRLQCGNVDPDGITSTPVYDPTSDHLLVVGLTTGGSGMQHVLTILSAADGSVVSRRPVDVPGLDPAVMNQRGALTIAAGRVYIPYGGNDGDCGAYRGAVVGVRVDGTGDLLSWTVPTPREGGIWAPSGIAQDSAGRLFVAVGNGAVGKGDEPYDGSDSVTALSTDLKRVDYFAPEGWRAENDADQDLGSTGPLVVGNHIWIQGKVDRAYLLDAANLGGIGHPAQTATGVCRKQFGGAAAHDSVIFAPCTDGLRQVVIDPDGTIRPGWRAPGDVTGSPVVGGGVVWSLSPKTGVLYAFDERTGRSRGHWSVGVTSRFASPTPAGPLMLVPTMSGITALSGA